MFFIQHGENCPPRKEMTVTVLDAQSEDGVREYKVQADHEYEALGKFRQLHPEVPKERIQAVYPF